MSDNELAPSGTELEIGGVLAAVDEVEATLAPQRDIIANAMMGHQALRTVVRQEYAERFTQASADQRLLTALMHIVLPPVYEQVLYNSTFLYPDTQRIREAVFRPSSFNEANLIQAHSLWHAFRPPFRNDEKLVFPRFNASIKRLPAFLLGVREESDSPEARLLLGVPGRYRESKYQEMRTKDTYEAPRIFGATMKKRALRRLEAEVKKRTTKYVNKAETPEDLPKELNAALDEGKWPNQFASPILLRKRRISMGIRIANLSLLGAEDLIDDYPIAAFDVPKRFLDLAGAFDKSAEFKAVLEGHIKSKQIDKSAK
jgi:hypothetical protein